MKKIKGKLIIFAVTVITFLAHISAASACSGWHYQPQIPESLLKK